ncbi:MAG: hypothetical protein QG599_2916 [Pseudomonadota bacterium]|nr:hypothetical protein [Pseudomonadota bacterium]
MQTHQITVPTTTQTRPSGKSFEQEVQERRENLALRAEQRRQDARRYQMRYQDEHFVHKVKRLAQKRWVEFDAIRREVEAFLPLANPTPAELRNYREQIARLVNQFRREAGWE